MTKDEILNMEAGREMDDLIATNVMKWILHPHKTHWMIYKGSVENTLRPTYRNYGDFCPSTDISAAWEVVEKMEADDINFEMADVIPSSDPIVYEFKFMKGLSDYYACEFTVPLAICRAALLAVMEN